MIKRYRKEHSQQADVIEAEFREMILGYDRVVVAENEAQQMFGEGIRLPVITNNEKVVREEQVPADLKELRDLMRDSQQSQGDFCYVDDDGETCSFGQASATDTCTAPNTQCGASVARTLRAQIFLIFSNLCVPSW